MGVLLMTDLSKLSETELLAIWNKDNFGLKGQLYKLEQEYIEAKEILDTEFKISWTIFQPFTKKSEGVSRL